MANKTYSEKLKDPRWQKKRLEMLSRDNFTCIKCCDDSSELHVHHKKYVAGKEPWDYPSDNFETLCHKCHEKQHSVKNEETILKNYDQTPKIHKLSPLWETKYGIIITERSQEERDNYTKTRHEIEAISAEITTNQNKLKLETDFDKQMEFLIIDTDLKKKRVEMFKQIGITITT